MVFSFFYCFVKGQKIPIMLAACMYEKIVSSIDQNDENVYCEIIKKLEYDYKLTLNAAAVSWKDAVDIRISNRYKSLFETLEDCYWVMFEALHLIYICIAKDGLNGPDVHLFYFDKRPFIIKLTGKITYIYTPDDK